jgi:CheY-like chemotaxis protein
LVDVECAESPTSERCDVSVQNALGPGIDGEAKVLIVEQNPDRRTMLELALSYYSRESRVFTARNSRSALLQLGIVQPDLILLDLTSPDGDEWETLQRIR